MTQLSYTFTLFLSLLMESLPFLLLGVFLSSWLLVFVDEQRLVAKMPRNPLLGAILGSSLGMLFPVCQYGNIPVTRRLLMEGIPLSVAISFLIAAPTINPIAIWFTWKAFPGQPSIVLYRLLFSWLMAVAIACLFSSYKEKPLSHSEETTQLRTRSTLLKYGTFLLPPDEGQPLHRVGNLVYEYKTATPINQPLRIALSLFCENARREILELGTILVLGTAIAAVLQFYLPETPLFPWGQNAITQILTMMGLGVVFSLGPLADVFFVGHHTETLLTGSILGFLLFSGVFDLKGIGLLFSTFRPKAVIYLLILVAEITILLTLLLDFYVS